MSSSGDLPPWIAPPQLVNRYTERRLLDQLLGSVRGRESRTLVIHGEPGIGKTALLEYLAAEAEGFNVVRTLGVQSEMELAFAGLHQLCSSMLPKLGAVPAPQRRALESAFGLRDGTEPDAFLIGLAVLSLLSEVAQEQPLLCLIDDFQWMDFASLQILAFVARRLGAESVGMVFATRVPDNELAGLPDLLVEGLRPADARTLLDSVLPQLLDSRIRDQIVVETRGNPLALLELPRGMTPLEAAIGFELPGAVPLTGTIEGSFSRRIAALPDDAQKLLLIAAAEPTGNTTLVWRAAARLGIEPESAKPSLFEELATLDSRVRFRHPLVRSAVYGSATADERRTVHAALAEVTDGKTDPERRAWHLAQASAGPDEAVARELDHAAELAVARGCRATAGAYLKEAVALSLDPREQARRAIGAAEGLIRTGGLDEAAQMLAAVEQGLLTDLERARVELVRAQLSYETNRGNEAPVLLVKAARELERSDPRLARSTYLDALSAAIFAGRLATPDGSVLDVAQAAANAPNPTGDVTAPDLLLEGLSASYIQGYEAGLGTIRLALQLFESGPPAADEIHWMWLASIMAMRLWDDHLLDTFSERHVRLARDSCALSELPMALTARTFSLLFAGRLKEAHAVTQEAMAVMSAIGSSLAPYGAFAVAALEGDTDRAIDLIQATLADVTRRGEGAGFPIAEWANAVLHNGLGRYDVALAAAERGSSYEPDPGSTIWPTVELIEAATRLGEEHKATKAYRHLAAMTSASGTDWALGIEKRSAALLATDDDAELLYAESIDHLTRTRQRFDLARARLLYGEWLRRRRRRLNSREQLRIAFEMFEDMGAAAFADRTGHELKATGGTVRPPVPAARTPHLTPQEAQIARMARDGLSNPEIGTRLFISTHTVQYHLKKLFVKLKISSRSELKNIPLGDAEPSG